MGDKSPSKGYMGVSQDAYAVIYYPRHPLNVPPIMAVHGMWATNRRWEKFGEFFSGIGFTFVALNLRYHHPNQSRSTLRLLGKTSVMDYVDDGLRCFDKFGPTPPILMGHSMGGPIVQKVAEARGSSGLILINSAPVCGVGLHTDPKYKRDIARYFLKILFSKPFKMSFKLASRYIMNRVPIEDRSLLYEGAVYESGRAARDILFGKVSVDEDKITCPKLIIGCRHDMIIKPGVAYDLSLKYGGSMLRILDNYGHWPQYEPGWKSVAYDISEWINAVL